MFAEFQRMALERLLRRNEIGRLLERDDGFAFDKLLRRMGRGG